MICIYLESIDHIKKLRKTVAGIEAEHILKYVRANPGTTVDKVAKQLQEEKICSRLTTLKVIDTLVENGLLKDERRRKYFHSLYVNEDYDPTDLVVKGMIGIIDELKDFYNNITKESEPIKLLDELKAYTSKLKYKKRLKFPRDKTGYELTA